jgi:fermentation-respiration switch protein FrsA (DUF1100 family)
VSRARICQLRAEGGDKTEPRDLQEAADYYLTPRGQHPNAPNKMLMTSLSALASFTGFDRADLLTQQAVSFLHKNAVDGHEGAASHFR